VPVEWEEEPFEWVSPDRFSVVRHYVRGPLASMRTSASLHRRTGGGTHLVYDVEARPRNLFGRAAIPIEIGLSSRRRFAAVFRRYDESLVRGREVPSVTGRRLAPSARARVEAARTRLLEGGASPELARRLCQLVAEGDELTVSRIRPYALADGWDVGRRETLELCLQATRAELLELRWELLCPRCRGSAASEESLGDIGRQVHCDTCLIDFTADFDRSVEVVFRPVSAIRHVEDREFCVAGPQMTPHVLVQQLMSPNEQRSLETRLGSGRYRLRALTVPGQQVVTVRADGACGGEARLEPDGWRPRELTLSERATIRLENATAEEQLFVLERTAWSDQAATAAAVTSLQVFRDLFATEALRPGEPIAVQSLTVVFTDLRGSTRYYLDVGDAPAFGSVLGHLDILRSAVASEGGAVVKALGDAIMAVFPRPLGAVKAMMSAQQTVAGRPLALKVGIHSGRCIAVNQNGVLDYFGSTVNLAARLVALSSGGDLVVSDAVLRDREVAALELTAAPVVGVLKGFEEEEVLTLWRIEP
jgi:class 3 adenylate cyclase